MKKENKRILQQITKMQSMKHAMTADHDNSLKKVEAEKIE
jgi:hypothetical protein